MQQYERQVKVGDTNIHYFELGKGSPNSSPVLFLHGYMLSADAYRTSLQKLAQTHKVIAPDLPGFGKSSIPSTGLKSYKDYAQIILAFTKKIDAEKFHLIGHSLGGGIAIQLTSLSPDSVRSLTLNDSAGIPLESGFIRLTINKFIEIVLQAFQTKLSAEFFYLVGSGFRNILFRGFATILILKIPSNEDLSSLFPSINAESLIVWGAKDLSVPVAHGKIIAEEISNSELRILESKYHDWGALFPSLFTVVVTKFLVRQEANC